MLTDFYGAFAPVTFTILGLWFIVVQTRHADWSRDNERRRRASAVSLHFALPGAMSLLSLIDAQSKTLWRASFTVSAVLGVVGLVALRPRRGGPDAGLLEVFHWLAVVLYVLVAAVALGPTMAGDMGLSFAPLRIEALLLSLLLFVGIVMAWLLMFDNVDGPPMPA
jgi:hypothetical protein